MSSRLGDYFRKVRLAKGMTLGRLARLVGYRNVNKGCRRIDTFEKTGRATPELFSKMTSILGVDDRLIEQLLDEDRREYQRWLSEPVKPYVVIRLLAAFYSWVDLPERIESLKEAERFAAGLALKHHLRTCLVWSRRISIYFKADGTVEGIIEASPGPVMKIGGRRCLLGIERGRIVLQQVEREPGRHDEGRSG